MRRESALLEYLQASRPLIASAACTLADWGSPRYGEVTTPAVPPSMVSVYKDSSVDRKKVEKWIDLVFHIGDSTVHTLRQHGRLRPMISAAAASLVMHFLLKRCSGEWKRLTDTMMGRLWQGVHTTFFR